MTSKKNPMEKTEGHSNGDIMVIFTIMLEQRQAPFQNHWLCPCPSQFLFLSFFFFQLSLFLTFLQYYHLLFCFLSHLPVLPKHVSCLCYSFEPGGSQSGAVDKQADPKLVLWVHSPLHTYFVEIWDTLLILFLSFKKMCYIRMPRKLDKLTSDDSC